MEAAERQIAELTKRLSSAVTQVTQTHIQSHARQHTHTHKLSASTKSKQGIWPVIHFFNTYPIIQFLYDLEGVVLADNTLPSYI